MQLYLVEMDFLQHGGHYIVIVGIEGNTLKIYDPYNYSGKFETSTRKGKVVVEGNTIYCSVENFKKYANYKGFFCYKKDNYSTSLNTVQNSKFKSGRVLVDIPITIAYRSNDKYIVDSRGYQFWIHKSVIKDDNKVYGLADICYDGGQVDMLQIFNNQFWCNEQYMSTIPIVQNSSQITNTVGENRKLKQSSIIYQNSNLTGSKFNYKANTTITILKNVNSSVDKIKIKSTGRVGYIRNNLYK